MSGHRQPPLISALVSTYNAARFMRGLLEDLERQTIAHRLEIVVVDSNSPQEEGAIVREFQRHYDNIVYVRTEMRENSHQSLNRGIRLAQGKYLTLACTDDRRRPDALERMVAVLEERPEIALVYSDLAVTDQENQTWESAAVIGHFRYPEFDRRLLFQVCYVGPQPVWRRSLHDRYGYFDPDFWLAGDYEMWLRLALKEEFLHIPEVLGLYLLSPTGNEHAHPKEMRRESEMARERHWPPSWGPRPPQRGGFFVPAPRLNKHYLKELLRRLRASLSHHFPLRLNKPWEKGNH